MYIRQDTHHQPTIACCGPSLPIVTFALLLGRLLVSALAVVTWARCDDPGIDVMLASGLVAALGLFLLLAAVFRQYTSPFRWHQLTGLPHGVTGLRLLFDFPRPPP